MIYYSQTDKRWASKIYSAKAPHTETMKSSGCGPTSAAMVVANLIDNTVTPADIADFSVKKGHRIDGVGTAFSLFGAVAKEYNLECTQSYNIEDAIRCVKADGMVVCSTNGGSTGLFSTDGHLFVMGDVENDYCIFYDPYHYDGKYNKTYRINRVTVSGNKIKVRKDVAKKEITTYFCFKLPKDDVLELAKKVSQIIEIQDLDGFSKALREAKKENSPLYWGYLKLVAEPADEEEPETILKVKEENLVDEPEPFTYHIEGTTHIIEIDPRNIWAVETQCATNKTLYNNFVNSIYFMPQKNGISFPQGIMVNAGEVICNYATHDKPVATLIIHDKDNVEMKYVSDITKEKNVWFAVSGFGVYPEITAEKEGFTGKFTDVLRCTARPIIGYRKKDNKIVIAVRNNSEAERAKLTAKNLGLDFAISLDGGGSTTLKIDGKYKFKGDGRKIYGGLIWA